MYKFNFQNWYSQILVSSTDITPGDYFVHKLNQDLVMDLLYIRLKGSEDESHSSIYLLQ